MLKEEVSVPRRALMGGLLQGIVGVIAAQHGVAWAQNAAPITAKAVLAGGCFWSMELAFESVPGVIDVKTGYTGGRTRNPTYQTAAADGHVEAVEVQFDPRRLSYAQLLEVFWRNIDPVSKRGQFCDSGAQYRSVIYVSDAGQQRVAEDSRAALMRGQAFGSAVPAGFKGGITTEIVKAAPFWPAEEEHQDYAAKKPLDYKRYSDGCGRAARLKTLWQSVR
jgi:peptide-methionine (S)-S-oxide reductase